MICGSSTPPGCHQGAHRLCAGLRTAEGHAELAAIATAELSAAGQLQVATALGMLTAIEDHLDRLHRQLISTARHVKGAKVLRARVGGWGRSRPWR
jgi:hypothetical protein